MKSQRAAARLRDEHTRQTWDLPTDACDAALWRTDDANEFQLFLGRHDKDLKPRAHED